MSSFLSKILVLGLFTFFVFNSAKASLFDRLTGQADKAESSKSDSSNTQASSNSREAGKNVDAPSTKMDQLSEHERRTIQNYQKTVPAVVNVSNIQVVTDFFFGMQQKREAGAGTGFVWDDQGHIVTNFHVVRDRDSEFMISFYKNQDQVKAKVVGLEPRMDIAVLKVEKLPKNVRPITTGSSENLVVGQQAIAIGNPFGLDHTMTSGIISALGRQIEGIGGVKIYNMIQTDASINPGNSGGPLLNSSGELIGMNTMIYSSSGSSAGLGFAVPVDTVKRVVPDLIKHGKVIRPALGISVLPESYKQHLFGFASNKSHKGVVIGQVEPGGAADKAGLKGMRRDRRGKVYLGDIILDIEGKEVNSLEDVFYTLDKYEIGQSVSLNVKNYEGEKRKVKVKLQSL